MIFRPMQLSDLDALRKIHAEFFAQEFAFPDFSQFLAAFVIEENDQIVTAGGIRNIIEAVLITNKDASARMRVKALEQALFASRFFSRLEKQAGIHAFVQDGHWEKMLLASGFVPCKGKALIAGV